MVCYGNMSVCLPDNAKIAKYNASQMLHGS